MKFDKSKILTAITARQAKEGQKGWFGECEDEIVRNLEYEPSSIKEINRSRAYAFRSESDFCLYPFFYPAPEPTYAERQAEWVRDNGVKVGTKVRFTKDFDADSDGSCCCEHRDAKGKEVFVNEIFRTYICVVVEGDYWSVPFTALEVIKEPTYRPFNEDELNDLVGKIVRNKQTGCRKLVTGKSTTSLGVNLDGKYINAKNLLNSFMMDDGNSPCGVREES